eukprot:3920188-Pleurochrysis_carterae.AAC.1
MSNVGVAAPALSAWRVAGGSARRLRPCRRCQQLILVWRGRRLHPAPLQRWCRRPFPLSNGQGSWQHLIVQR